MVDLDCFNESRASDMNGSRGDVDCEWQKSKQTVLRADGHCTVSKVFLPSRKHNVLSLSSAVSVLPIYTTLNAWEWLVLFSNSRSG